MDKVIEAVSDASGTSAPAKTALIILSDGAEESEVVITADVLSRGGMKVVIAGFSGDSPVKCTRGVQIKPEMSLDQAMDLAETKPWDVVILPGGPKGTENLVKSVAVGNLLKRQELKNGWIAAICGGPLALKSHSIGFGKTVTAHKTKWNEMEDGGHYKVSHNHVVIDGNLITSQGPGTAFDFGLAIIEKLVGSDKIGQLKEDLALKV